jgi:hypothetical protein
MAILESRTWCPVKFMLTIASIRRTLNHFAEYATQRLSPAAQASTANGATAKKYSLSLGGFCLLIFILALGVRLLHWQDTHLQILENDRTDNNLGVLYYGEARRMLDDGSILYPRERDPDNASPIIHPPGNSVLMAACLYFFNDADAPVRTAQIICASVSASMVCLIAAQLLPFAAAVIAGMLVAFSPHLGYYSIWLSPDSTAVLPVLLAIFLIIRASKSPRLIFIIAAGAMIGLSCWFRANALFLAPFLAIVVWRLSQPGKRLRPALALVAASLLILAPITIRNWLVYHQFIPVSLGAGVTLIQGIANYDKANQFAMPNMDMETTFKDAEWNDRPDYAGNLWKPEAIKREKVRTVKGLEVIRANPLWFSKTMLQRMAFMLRYNDFRPQDMSYNTTIAPTISATPTFAHQLLVGEMDSPALVISPAEMVTNGNSLTAETEARLAPDATVQFISEATVQGEQYALAPLPVKPNTDYLLRVATKMTNGAFSIKVKSTDPRITFAWKWIAEMRRKRSKKEKQQASDEKEKQQDDQPMDLLPLAFSSGDNDKVCIVITTGETTSTPSLLQLGNVELFELGATPNQWTRLPRAVIGGIQKNVYKTNLLRLLMLSGIILLAFAGQKRTLILLLAVPLYYLCLQSVLHTEYRYILAIHYFLFVLAAVTIYFAGVMLIEMLRRARQRL